MKGEWALDGKRVRVVQPLWNGADDHIKVGEVVTFRRPDRLKADDGREIHGVAREDFEPIPLDEDPVERLIAQIAELHREVRRARGGLKAEQLARLDDPRSAVLLRGLVRLEISAQRYLSHEPVDTVRHAWVYYVEHDRDPDIMFRGATGDLGGVRDELRALAKTSRKP